MKEHTTSCRMAVNKLLEDLKQIKQLVQACFNQVYFWVLSIKTSFYGFINRKKIQRIITEQPLDDINLWDVEI